MINLRRKYIKMKKVFAITQVDSRKITRGQKFSNFTAEK